MRRQLLFLLLLNAIALQISAQETVPAKKNKFKCPKIDHPWSPKNWIPRTQLRQSFQGKLEKDEAAFFNIVNPHQKPSSYNLSVALGYNVFCDAKLSTLRPFIEWQKNTVADKPQNVFLTGLDYQLQFWDPTVQGHERKWTPFLLVKGNYKNDIIKKVEGAQASLLFFPAWNSKNDKFYPLPDAVTSGTVLEFFYNTYIGIEYENRGRSVTVGAEGTAVRAYGRITGTFNPFPKLLDKRLEFIPDFTYRQAMSNNSALEKDKNSIWKWSANLVLLSKEKSGIADFKFGVDYVNGVDPTKGFDKQRVITYSFKIKI